MPIFANRRWLDHVIVSSAWKLALFAALLLTFDTRCLAQHATDNRVLNENPEYKACIGRAGSNTLALEECSNAELADLIKKLSGAYRRVASLRGDWERDLKSSEKAWESYVNAECSFRAHWLAGGGSGEGLEWTGCKIDLVYERTRDFDNALRYPDKVAP
ncbi:lysozyme inhibitor LprI family protein [Lichenicoccus sp.]|uniref:lysozyme inhibitor LprI family protein n=1 Tax=Lichenicoccus sp. TaxID=2781899 RepID=UPI003D0DB993